jgi:DNA-binding NarL/FixJ family response regulator
MKPLSVMLVDDHKLFREGLKLLISNLKETGEVTEASDGKEFMEKLKNGIPDIVFMDIDMPVMDGIEATHLAVSEYPGINIIALSMYGEEDYYTRMINAGVKGFLLKNSDIEDVVDAMLHVYSGKNYFSQEILSGLLHQMNRKKAPLTTDELSERETEVLYHICKGLSNQEIADILFLSKRTVDKHRENLLSKTNSKNTAGLVIYAIRKGIIEI